MLEAIRRNSRSVIIYLIFGILIAVFIVSFGPQSGRGPMRGKSGGCGGEAGYVVKVGDREVEEQTWRYGLLGLNLSGNGMRARAMRSKETVMDLLIERELLAQAAEVQGFRVSDAEVEANVAKGDVFILGRRVPGQAIFFKDGIFDYDRLESYARSLGLPGAPYFVEEQKRELLAQKERELLIGSVRVSPEEVLARYQQQHSKVWLQYVKFEPRKYAHGLELSDADVESYLAAHDADIKKKYDLDKNLYKARAKEVRIRHVFVKSALKDPAVEPETGAAPAPAKKPAAADPAKAKADAILAKIKGGADFADVAKKDSDDDRSAKRGGDLGWRPVASLGWGEELNKAVDPLQIGQTSEVIETSRGFHIVKVEGRREGDLTYDQVKKDLAEEAAREDKAKMLAKSDADTALAKAQGGTPLEAQFPMAEPPARPGMQPGMIPGMPPGMPIELTPGGGDDEEGGGGGGNVIPMPTPAPTAPATPATPVVVPPAPAGEKHGYYDAEGNFVVPAKRYLADDTGTAAGAPAPIAPAPVEPAAKPAKPKATATVTATNAAPATATAKSKTTAVTPPAGSDDPDKPKLVESGEVTRNGATVSGSSGEKYVGKSAELAKAVFEQIKPGDLGPKVYEVEDGFVVVKVVKREEPNMEEFAKDKANMASEFAFERAFHLTDAWTQRRCQEVKADGKISVDETKVEYNDVDEKTGKARKTTYAPCTSASAGGLGGLGGGGMPFSIE